MKILCDECKRKDECGKRPRTEEELEDRKHDVCFQFEKEVESE